MLRASRAINKRTATPVRLFSAARAAYNQPQKSPMQVFYETFKLEVQKLTELKDNIKALQDETGRMAELDSFKRAMDAYNKAQAGSLKAGDALRKTGEAVGDVAYKAWELPVGRATRTTVIKTATTIDKAIDPVRQTKAYKEVANVIDDGLLVAYGGYVTKEQREAFRKAQAEHNRHRKVVKADETAGSEMVTTDYEVSGELFGQKWESFKQTLPVGRRVADLGVKFEELENGLVLVVRTVLDKVGGFFFTESESGKVYRLFKQMDPTFTLDQFQKNLRQYIVPELLEAYVKNDDKVLKQWLSEAPFNIWQAHTKQFTEQGLFSDLRILDIRGVEVLLAKMLPPNDIPVLVVSCRAQEIHLYRKAKTGEIAAGTLENIQLSTYVMVLTRDPEQLDNPETEGWKVLEMVRGALRLFT